MLATLIIGGLAVVAGAAALKPDVEMKPAPKLKEPGTNRLVDSSKEYGFSLGSIAPAQGALGTWVPGFRVDTADGSPPDPEAVAKAYLRLRKATSQFYSDRAFAGRGNSTTGINVRTVTGNDANPVQVQDTDLPALGVLATYPFAVKAAIPFKGANPAREGLRARNPIYQRSSALDINWTDPWSLGGVNFKRYVADARAAPYSTMGQSQKPAPLPRSRKLGAAPPGSAQVPQAPLGVRRALGGR